MSDHFLTIDFQKATLRCHGEWTLRKLIALKKYIAELALPQGLHFIDGSAIHQMDSAGALVLHQYLESLKADKQALKMQHFKAAHQTLLDLVNLPEKNWQQLPTVTNPNWLARIGISVVDVFIELKRFLQFIGELTVISLRLLFHPKRIPLGNIMSIIESAGVRALPIIGLLSFLIGVVLAYQMGLQLKSYGANVYIVDLLGLAIPREFAPLMTAIIVAGRSGSAFTAQLGTMKIREEIDALRTMGIVPAEILILPKLFALFLLVPLLTVWASLFAIIGGMVVSKSMFDLSYTDFLRRFYEAIPVSSYFTGMLKTPVFGLIIASIGCYQGMKVTGSAVSIGQRTTLSVVQSIFFIIVADAIFSILFSWLGI